jgi:leucyl-tRNA synthetase
MDYQFKKTESEWQKFWAENQTFKVENDSSKPKYYVMDMFPYPSGAGLHVGHPLGYIASDIFARYKRLKGFNVLHPMGYDSFGLPAEQYAIQTGQHPAITTEQNIATYRRQLDQIGFSFDWSREVRTSSPDYYKWTQWIFMQLFNSWYNLETDKAEPISTLIQKFETEGNHAVKAVSDEDVLNFSAEEYASFTDQKKQEELLKYRLTYLRESTVNWCAALGTVLANDEVKDGFSERGGYPVEQKKMMQWSMRITAYAERLLQGLDTIDWPEPLKEMQRNWIGKSVGAMVRFSLTPALSKGEGGKVGDQAGYATADPSMWEVLKVNSRENRQNQTEAEELLWQNLRNSKTGYKIRRQHAIDGYIADFVCLKKGLVIEVDGGYHLETTEQDEIRTQVLNELGFEIIRFTNEEVVTNVNKVVKTIKAKLDSQPERYSSAANSLSPGEGWGEAKESQNEAPSIEVFTTRVDTTFGVTFMVLAPEHELVKSLTTPDQKANIDAYIDQAKKKSELDRMADTKTVSGAFTGSYVINPLDGNKIPVWIADYVLAGYGTGAVMGVPSGDARDHRFATHFNLPIVAILDTQKEVLKEADATKEGRYINSGFINCMAYKEATAAVIAKLEELGAGKAKINYRQRDAIFGRQRYWGEPVPVYFKDGLPQLIDENELPLVLPEVDKYLPTESGEPPLARAEGWSYKPSPESLTLNPSPKERDLNAGEANPLSPGEGRGEAASYPYELSTMPGWAGSSWYWYRYMDSKNEQEFASKEAIDYWKDVDLYIGGSEHATGHLLYSRFWNKFLKDLGLVVEEEPFKKLINQGMIQGRSNFVYRLLTTGISTQLASNFDDNAQFIPSNDYPVFISKSIKDELDRGNLSYENRNSIEHKLNEIRHNLISLYPGTVGRLYLNKSVQYVAIHVDVNIVSNDALDIEAFKNSREEYANAAFILEDGSLSPGEGRGEAKYICGHEVEKMSKSKFNVVNPDEMIERYGADTLRMYEMFLGPLEQSKPWNTNGIEGVFKFLRKFWKLFHDDNFNFRVTNEAPTKAELKSLHKIIKKVEDDVERFSFNTSVSSFMIAVNELTELKCAKRSILQDMVVILSPYAPHICEELWKLLGNEAGSLSYATYPKFNPDFLVEDAFSYPISINGKTKTNLNIPLSLDATEVEALVLADENVQKYLAGQKPKKVIVVKGRIVNMVV